LIGADNPEMDLEELLSAAWAAQRAQLCEYLGFYEAADSA